MAGGEVPGHLGVAQQPFHSNTIAAKVVYVHIKHRFVSDPC